MNFIDLDGQSFTKNLMIRGPGIAGSWVIKHWTTPSATRGLALTTLGLINKSLGSWAVYSGVVELVATGWTGGGAVLSGVQIAGGAYWMAQGTIDVLYGANEFAQYGGFTGVYQEIKDLLLDLKNKNCAKGISDYWETG